MHPIPYLNLANHLVEEQASNALAYYQNTYHFVESPRHIYLYVGILPTKVVHCVIEDSLIPKASNENCVVEYIMKTSLFTTAFPAPS